MSLYPPELPWLHKPVAVAAAGRMIVDSALAAQGLSRVPRPCQPTDPRWLPPRRWQDAPHIREHELPRSTYTAPANNLTLAFRHLAHAAGPPARARSSSSSRTSSPPGAGRLADGGRPRLGRRAGRPAGPSLGAVLPGGGRHGTAARRARRRAPARAAHPPEAEERREANERRHAALLRTFAALQLDPVLLSSTDTGEILRAFMRWHERRRHRLRQR